MSVEIVNGKWHGVAKQRKELGIDGWEVIIFYGSAISYCEFHCKVYPDEEIRQAIENYIKKRRFVCELPLKRTESEQIS